MNRFTIILPILLVMHIAVLQPAYGETDDLDIVLELIDMVMDANCFHPDILQGLPRRPDDPAINPNLPDYMRTLCIESAIRKSDRLAMKKRDMLEFMVGPLPHRSER